MRIEPMEDADEAPKPAPGTRGRVVLVRLVLVASLLALGWTFLKAAVYGACTSSFIEQMNRLGRTLKPGEVGTVRVTRFLADEVILLTPYSSWGPVAGTDDDGECLLVWLWRGHVLATVNFPTASLRFGMEGNPHPQRWKLDQRGDVRLELVLNAQQSRADWARFRFPSAGRPAPVSNAPREVIKL